MTCLSARCRCGRGSWHRGRSPIGTFTRPRIRERDGSIRPSVCKPGWFFKGPTSFPASSSVSLPARRLRQPEPLGAPVLPPAPELCAISRRRHSGLYSASCGCHMEKPYRVHMYGAFPKPEGARKSVKRIQPLLFLAFESFNH